MRVLIADDHALFRDSLKSLLEARDVEVVAEAESGEEAIRLTGVHDPDIVLMDLSMPGMGGMEAIRRLTEEHPDLRVVVLSASTDEDDLFEALRAGAHGYLPKDLEADSFFELLERAKEGEPALTPALSRLVLRAFARGPERQEEDPDALTDREREVLTLMTRGVTTNRRLARELEISENTVKFHVRNILDKLHLHNRAQAVSHALRTGMVDPDAENGDS